MVHKVVATPRAPTASKDSPTSILIQSTDIACHLSVSHVDKRTLYSPFAKATSRMTTPAICPGCIPLARDSIISIHPLQQQITLLRFPTLSVVPSDVFSDVVASTCMLANPQQHQRIKILWCRMIASMLTSDKRGNVVSGGGKWVSMSGGSHVFICSQQVRHLKFTLGYSIPIRICSTKHSGFRNERLH